MPFTPIVNEFANVESGYNLPHISPADPSVDPGSALSMPTDIDSILFPMSADPSSSVYPEPAFSMPTNIDGVLSMFSQLPTDSVDHTTLNENPSRPSEFAAATWHVLENNGSEFDFSDLTPLIPAIDHPATTSSQSTLHHQFFPMDTATGLGASVPQAIGNANFFNFPLVGHRINSKDKRTVGVCAFGILLCLVSSANFNLTVDRQS